MTLALSTLSVGRRLAVNLSSTSYAEGEEETGPQVQTAREKARGAEDAARARSRHLPRASQRARGRGVGNTDLSSEQQDLRDVLGQFAPQRRPRGPLDDVGVRRAGFSASRATRSLLQAAVRRAEWMDRRMARPESALGRDRGAHSRRIQATSAEEARCASRVTRNCVPLVPLQSANLIEVHVTA